MDNKVLLTGCIVALVVGAILFIIPAIVTVGLMVTFVKSSDAPMPKELREAKVVLDSELLSKRILIQDGQLGSVTDIVMGELDPSPGPEIGVVGLEGALFLDPGLEIKSSVSLKSDTGHVEIIDVDGDGVCEFVNSGSVVNDASLIGHDGQVMWTYGGTSGVDHMCGGDIDGDGAPEFAVGYTGGGGVHLVDKNGNRIWRRSDGNVWHVEMVDTNDDGLLEIMHSNARGEMTIRDSRGKVVRRSDPFPYFSDFSICRWPGKNDREYALLSEGDIIWILDFRGRAVAQLSAPGSGKNGEARGTAVMLRADCPEYFGVVVDIGHRNRAVLYVYAPNQDSVYREVIAERCQSVAAVPVPDSRTELLLVGGEDRVWRYEANHAPDDSPDQVVSEKAEAN